MSEKKTDRPEPDLSCSVCMKHIDHSEAETFEVDEYVHHFCGLDCYSKWQQDRKDRGEENKG